MKSVIRYARENKKVIIILLSVLIVVLLALIATNLNSTERDAYQAMYDTNKELYSSYIDYAQKYEDYGYSSEAQELYTKAYALDDKIEKYENELTSLNLQIGLFAILLLGAVIGIVWLAKAKSPVAVLPTNEEGDSVLEDVEG